MPALKHTQFNDELLSKIASNKYTNKTLDLSNQDLTDSQMKALTAALNKNKSIKRLNLEYNQLTGNSIIELASCKTLMELRCVTGNDIKISDLFPFIENTTLTKLPFQGNSLTGQVVRAQIAENKNRITDTSSCTQETKVSSLHQQKLIEDMPPAPHQNTAIESELPDDGEGCFSLLLQYGLLDLDEFKGEAEYISWYLAMANLFYMHNASHNPVDGFGKAQERETKKALFYYRSQRDNAHRLFCDGMLDLKKGKSYLPQNQAYTKQLKQADVSKKLTNNMPKLDEYGFVKTAKTLDKNVGYLFGYAGVRASNFTAYRMTFDRLAQITNGKAGLAKKLSQLQTNKIVSKKITKLSRTELISRISYQQKRFKEKLGITSPHSRLDSLINNHRQSLIDKVIRETAALNLLKVKKSEGSSCIEIDLYPNWQDKIRGSQNYSEGVTNVIISYFIGLLNYHAEKAQKAYCSQRRQSFGFSRATLTDVGSMTIRISLGFEPHEYSSIIITALDELNTLLTEFDFRNAADENLKQYFAAKEKSRKQDGKNTERTGNFFLGAMRSEQNKLQACFDAHQCRQQSSQKTKAFSNYLEKVVKRQENLKSVIKSNIYIGNNKENSEVQKGVIVKVLENVLYHVHTKIDTFSVPTEETTWLHSYWHALNKLSNKCTNANELLAQKNTLGASEFYKQATALVDDILEYFFILDAINIVQLSKQEQQSLVTNLKRQQKTMLYQALGCSEENTDIYYADSGQQAIIANLLAMDMQLIQDRNKEGKDENTIYLFERSYYEIDLFLQTTNLSTTKIQKDAHTVLVDIRDIDKFIVDDFSQLKTVTIDITHNVCLTNTKLIKLVNALHEKGVWVSLVNSSLKHEQLGLDKIQSGRISIIKPDSKKLSDNVQNELSSISGEAMHPLMASFFYAISSITHPQFIPNAQQTNIKPSAISHTFFQSTKPEKLIKKTAMTIQKSLQNTKKAKPPMSISRLT